MRYHVLPSQQFPLIFIDDKNRTTRSEQRLRENGGGGDRLSDRPL